MKERHDDDYTLAESRNTTGRTITEADIANERLTVNNQHGEVGPDFLQGLP